MERTITAILTNSNDKKVFNSNATTLGELKAEMTAQGIDYHNMDFMEGLTHTTMIDDAAILPSNVNYKGQVTNNLVFMLSTTNKQIRSGVMSESRMKLYTKIKKYNLEEIIKSLYKKDYTHVSSINLEKVITKEEEAILKNNVPTDRKGIYEYIKENNLKDIINAKYGNYTRVDTATLVEACKKAVCGKTASCKKSTPIKKETSKKKEMKSPYSDSELDAIINNLRK